MAFLNRIQIANFLPDASSSVWSPMYRYTDLYLDGQNTLICSPNGTGKTSMVFAIYTILCRHIRFANFYHDTIDKMAPHNPEIAYSHIRITVIIKEGKFQREYIFGIYGDKEDMKWYFFPGTLEDLPIASISDDMQVKYKSRKEWVDLLKIKNVVTNSSVADWKHLVSKYLPMPALERMAKWADNKGGEGSESLFSFKWNKHTEAYDDAFFKRVIADEITAYNGSGSENKGREIMGTTLITDLAETMRQLVAQNVATEKSQKETFVLDTELKEMATLIQAGKQRETSIAEYENLKKNADNCKADLFYTVGLSGIPGFYSVKDLSDNIRRVCKHMAFLSDGTTCIHKKMFANICNIGQKEIDHTFSSAFVKSANEIQFPNDGISEKKATEYLAIPRVLTSKNVSNDIRNLLKLCAKSLSYADTNYARKTVVLTRSAIERKQYWYEKLTLSKEASDTRLASLKTARKNADMGRKAIEIIAKKCTSQADKSLIIEKNYSEILARAKSDLKKVMVKIDENKKTLREMMELLGSSKYNQFIKEHSEYANDPTILLDAWIKQEETILEEKLKLDVDHSSKKAALEQAKTACDNAQKALEQAEKEYNEIEELRKNAEGFLNARPNGPLWEENFRQLESREKLLVKKINDAATKLAELRATLKPLVAWREKHPGKEPENVVETKDKEMADLNTQNATIEADITKNRIDLKALIDAATAKENRITELTSDIVKAEQEKNRNDRETEKQKSLLEKAQALDSELQKQLVAADSCALNGDLNIYFKDNDSFAPLADKYVSVHHFIENLKIAENQKIDILSGLSMMLSSPVVQDVETGRLFIDFLEENDLAIPVLLGNKLAEIVYTQKKVDGHELYLTQGLFIGHTSANVLLIFDEKEREKRKQKVRDKIALNNKAIKKHEDTIKACQMAFEKADREIAKINEMIVETRNAADQDRNKAKLLEEKNAELNEKMHANSKQIGDIKGSKEYIDATNAVSLKEEAKKEPALIANVENAKKEKSTFSEKFPRNLWEAADNARPFLKNGGMNEHKRKVTLFKAQEKAHNECQEAMKAREKELALVKEQQEANIAKSNSLRDERGPWSDKTTETDLRTFYARNGKKYIDSADEQTDRLNREISSLKEKTSLEKWDYGDDVCNAYNLAETYIKTLSKSEADNEKAFSIEQTRNSRMATILERLNDETQKLNETIVSEEALCKECHIELVKLQELFYKYCINVVVPDDFIPDSKFRHLLMEVTNAVNLRNMEEYSNALDRLLQLFMDIDFEVIDGRLKIADEKKNEDIATYDKKVDDFTNIKFARINHVLEILEQNKYDIKKLEETYSKYRNTCDKEKEDHRKAREKAAVFEKNVKNILKETLKEIPGRVGMLKKQLAKSKTEEFHFELRVNCLDPVKDDDILSNLIYKIQGVMTDRVKISNSTEPLKQKDFLEQLKHDIYNTIFRDVEIRLVQGERSERFTPKKSEGQMFCYNMVWLFALAELSARITLGKSGRISGFFLIDGIFSKMSKPEYVDAAFRNASGDVQIIGYCHDIHDLASAEKMTPFPNVFIGETMSTGEIKNGKFIQITDYESYQKRKGMEFVQVEKQIDVSIPNAVSEFELEVINQ